MMDLEEMKAINSDIQAELDFSFKKHGSWGHMHNMEMFYVIYGEMREVNIAIKKDDLNSDHGVYRELAQVAACCIKMMEQIKKRGGAMQ